MATVLIAWELGAGWGHVSRLRSIAIELRRRGHDVVAALRDVAATGRLFIQQGIPCLAAPFKLGWPTNCIRPARSFAHILHNIGFCDVDELDALVAAWESLFDLVEPDAIIFDHSPTALLASRTTTAARVLFGDGFCCPPGGDILPPLAPWRSMDPAGLFRDERRTLAVANRVLRMRGARQLVRLSALYQEVDNCLLTTFAELDHFGERREAIYHGPGVACIGTPINVPSPGPCPRAVAYVRPYAELSDLMRVLDECGVATLMYCPGVNRRTLPESHLVRVLDRPIDLRRAAQSADFAILNASHGTTAEMMLHGVPLLQIPLHMEQQLVAHRTVLTGAGLAVNRTKPTQIAAAVRRLLDGSCYRHAAERLACKYRAFDPLTAVAEMADQVESSLRVAA